MFNRKVWDMIKLTQLFLLLAFTGGGMLIHAQSSAPPLSPEELLRLHAVKAWDIVFTYHFTDIRAGSRDVIPGYGTGGRGIDHWTLSFNNERQYVVKFTVAGKNSQSDCAPGSPPGSDSCLTKYQYPGSITNALETFRSFDEVHVRNGCPEPPDGNLTGPGILTLLQTYTISADRILDGTGAKRVRGKMEIDYGYNPPRASGIFDTPPVDYLQTQTWTGCQSSDNHSSSNLIPSRIIVEIYPYPYNGTGPGGTDVKIENGAFVIRGSSTVNEVFNAYSVYISTYDSNTAQIGGSHRTTFRDWVIREHIDSSITVTRPTADMLFVSGETEIIQWTTDVTDSVRIFYSVNSGNDYTEIVDSIPASAHAYAWKAPDTLLSRYCRIKVVSMKDTTRFGVSETYRMKGYVLTTFLGNGDYLAYDPAWDRWGFKNTSADVWPASWYARFNYSGTDPFTGLQYSQWQGGGLGRGTFSSAQSSDHPDWPSFVNTFSVSACYANTTQGNYSRTALARWASWKGNWGGSCFGIALSNAIAFRNSGSFGGQYPQYPFFVFPIQVTSDTNTIPVVNELFSHQFGNPHVRYRNTVAIFKTPNQTLNEIKAMCLSDTASVRTLGILNNGPGGGGHAILAYKVKKDPTLASAYDVYVYDNSWSDSTNAYIVIDTTLNGGQGGWSYSLWPGWGGSKWIYLRDPAINYLTNPTFTKVDPRDRFSPFILSDEVLEISTVNGATVRIQDPNGNTSGYFDSLILNEIPGSAPLVIENGSKMPPIGYSLPMNAYSVELSNFKTPESRVFFFTGNRSLVVDRSDAQEHQNDLLYFDGNVSLANHDAQGKVVHLTNIINESVREKQFDVSSITLTTGDQLMMGPYGPDGMKLVSFGSQKTYELELEYSTDTGIARYKSGSVPFNANTAHVFAPDWPVIGDGRALVVYVDEGNDGTVDDTLALQNQLTGVRNEGHLDLPDRFQLHQNYPNPFNPSTTIRYGLPTRSYVTLAVFNTLGQQVAQLVNEELESGYHEVTFDGSGLSSGVYFYRLRAGDFVETKRFLLLK